MQRIVTNLKAAVAWLRKMIGLAAVVIVIGLSSQAKAEDPVQIKMQQLQNELNRMTDLRLTNLEKRTTLIEQKIGGTSYTPGSAPYTPPVASSSYPPCPDGKCPAPSSSSSGKFKASDFGNGPGQLPPAYRSYWRSKGWSD